MLNQIHITLDSNKEQCFSQVTIAQSDVMSTRLIVTLTQDGAPITLYSNEEYYLVMRLPNGRDYARQKSSSNTANTIVFDLDEGKFGAIPGYTDEAYVEVDSGGLVSTTSRFSVRILRDAKDGSVLSEDYDDKVQDAIDKAKASATEASSSATAANKAIGNISAKVTRNSTGASISVTDKDGTQSTAQVYDGNDAGALSGTQIDTVLADQTPTGAGFLDGGGLKRFFDGLQAQYPIYKGTAAAEFNRRVSLGEDITAKFDSGEYSAEVAAQTFGGLALGQRIERPITIDGVNYTARAILGDGNSFYGYNSYAMIDKPHIACPVVIYDSNGNALSHNFDATNTDGGYVGVDIHAYLVDKVIPAIVNGFGADHVLKHQVLLSNAVSNGKSSSWSWVPDSYGELMSAAQCCGTEISCSYFDTGEAYRELSLFRYVRPNQVFGSIPVWLRDILTASYSAVLGGNGGLGPDNVTASGAVVPLILLA